MLSFYAVKILLHCDSPLYLLCCTSKTDHSWIWYEVRYINFLLIILFHNNNHQHRQQPIALVSYGCFHQAAFVNATAMRAWLKNRTYTTLASPVYGKYKKHLKKESTIVTDAVDSVVCPTREEVCFSCQLYFCFVEIRLKHHHYFSAFFLKIFRFWSYIISNLAFRNLTKCCLYKVFMIFPIW